MRLLLTATVAATLRGFFLPFARHFRERGWRVDGAALGITACEDCASSFDRVWEVPWSRNPLDPANLLVVPRLLRSLVQQEAYDLVHVSTPVASFVTRLALRRLRAAGRPKIIYTAHGFQFHRQGAWWTNAIYLGAERLTAPWTDYVTVMNLEDLAMGERYRLMPPGHVVYIPGVGIDRQEYCRAKVSEGEVAGIRRELRLDASQPLFLMIAEFIKRKRHEDVLRAFASVRCREARLALAGDGPLLAQHRRLAAGLGLEGRVHFLGVRRDIPALLCAAQATLLPSDREGLPRAVMESLSLAVPVIGSDIRGTRDLLADGAGILVKVGDCAAWTQAMEWILDHPELAGRMGQRGREKLAAFDLSTVLARHERLYADACVPGAVTPGASREATAEGVRL